MIQPRYDVYLESTRRGLSESKVWRSQHKGVPSYGLYNKNTKLASLATICSFWVWFSLATMYIWKVLDGDSLNPKFEGPRTKGSRVMALIIKIKKGQKGQLWRISCDVTVWRHTRHIFFWNALSFPNRCTKFGSLTILLQPTRLGGAIAGFCRLDLDGFQ